VIPFAHTFILNTCDFRWLVHKLPNDTYGVNLNHICNRFCSSYDGTAQQPDATGLNIVYILVAIDTALTGME